MEVFRLAREQYANSLSGKGAAIKGARWNSAGVEVVYTGAHRSLAIAEVAVHFTLSTLPDDYMMVTIYIPERIKIKEVHEKDLPPDWHDFPFPVSTQKFGDDFVYQGEFCLLKIPSVVTKGDFNILINPHHKDFKTVEIIKTEKFPFDLRIFQ